jgi:hypothetical protein
VFRSTTSVSIKPCPGAAEVRVLGHVAPEARVHGCTRSCPRPAKPRPARSPAISAPDLADARLLDQETDGASQEALAGPSRCLGVGHHGKQALRETPAAFIVVHAAQPVVADTGDARPGHVDAHRGVLVRHDHWLPSLARHDARGRAADMGCKKPACHQRQTSATRSVGRPGADGGLVALRGITRARRELTALTRPAPHLPDRPVVRRYRP